MDNTNIKIIPDTIENRNKVSQFINLWDDNFPNSLRKFYNFYEGLPIDKPELEWKCFIFGNGEKPRGFTPFKSPIVGISNYFMVYGTYIFTDIRKHIHSMGWALLNNDVISLDIHPEGVQVKAKQKFLVSLDNINNKDLFNIIKGYIDDGDLLYKSLDKIDTNVTNSQFYNDRIKISNSNIDSRFKRFPNSKPIITVSDIPDGFVYFDSVIYTCTRTPIIGQSSEYIKCFSQIKKLITDDINKGLYDAVFNLRISIQFSQSDYDMVLVGDAAKLC